MVYLRHTPSRRQQAQPDSLLGELESGCATHIHNYNAHEPIKGTNLMPPTTPSDDPDFRLEPERGYWAAVSDAPESKPMSWKQRVISMWARGKCIGR